MTVSVLIPTRGRPELLARAVGALYDNADDPDHIEVLARFDSDAYHEPPPGVLAVIGEPLGYVGMGAYYNELAEAATGDWLLIYNDDAMVSTRSWDTIIESRGPGLKNLSIDNNHGRQYACFPCVPKRWFDICGHLALDTRVDSWLQQVAIAADCFVEENDVFILHDRYDLTGNNEDETYRRRYLDAEFWVSFDSPENWAARVKDAELIRAAIGG